jgi:lysophospholipase L1-like esterase
MTARDPFAEIAGTLARGCRRRRISSFVALGDSFTAGRGCEPEARWANRLAAALRARTPDLAYSNLAVDGATSAKVLDQVGPAIQLEPDLVTVICGANDVIGTVRPDPDGYGERLASILDRLAGSLPRVAILTATSPESWRFLDLRPRTRARVVDGIGRLNEVTRAVAASRSIPVVDVVGHPGLDEADNFLADGLHPSPSGHERAAVEFARALHEHFGIDSDVVTNKEEEGR